MFLRTWQQKSFKHAVYFAIFVKERDGFTFEDTLTVTGFQDCATGRQNHRGGLQATDVRQKFAEYFMSDQGSVPWQMSKI